jgi:hypothetical protein
LLGDRTVVARCGCHVQLLHFYAEGVEDMQKIDSRLISLFGPTGEKTTTRRSVRPVRARPKRYGLLAAAVASGTIMFASLAPSASASAYGCTTSGWGLPWYGLNSAYTCVDIEGWGNHVVSVQGQWGGVGTICNYKFQIQFTDVNNRVYETDDSPLHVGCRGGAAVWTKNYNDTKRTGRVCVQVLESGAPRGGAACESIA